MVPSGAQLMKRLNIPAMSGKSLKDTCYIVSRPLSSATLDFLRVCIMIKDFNYSRKSCNDVNFQLKSNTVLQIFVFICSKRVDVGDKTLIN